MADHSNEVLPSGAEIAGRVRKITPQTLISFSRGKDSIGVWLSLRDKFDVYMYSYYVVPGLEFEQEDIARWEKITGRHIVQLPAPGLYRMIKYMTYQPLDRFNFINSCELPEFSHDDLQEEAGKIHGMGPEPVWNALGIRAKDSIARRFEVMRSGGINYSRRIYYPICDLGKTELVDMIKKSGIKLPIDYKIWGRSFDGIAARFLVPMKKQLPRDYKRILEFFPLAEAEVFRAERAWKK